MKLPRLLIGPARELRRPRFPVCRDLVSKQLRAAAALPENSIKPLRDEDPEHVAEWPRDGNGSPIDWERGLPIG